MEEEKKFQHAQYLIGFLNNYSLSRPSSQEVVIACHDGRIRTYLLILTSISEILQKVLKDVSEISEEDILLIVPDLDLSTLETFFRYLYSGDVATVFSPDDLCSLEEVFRTFSIDFRPFESLRFSPVSPFDEVEDVDDDGDQVDDDHVLSSDTEEDENSNESLEDMGSNQRKRPNILSSKNKSKKRRRITVNDYQDVDETNVDVFVKDQRISCRFCTKTYQHIKARNKHLISDHLEECKRAGLVYPCKLCCTCFVSYRGLEKHMGRIHRSSNNSKLLKECRTEDPKTRADILESVSKMTCPFDHEFEVCFTSVRDLKAHVKDSHPDKDKSCWACGLNCASRDDLEEHIQTHLTQTPEGRCFYNCDQCQRKFLSEYNLVMHKRRLHSSASTLLCKICDKQFKNEKFLRVHEAKHISGEALMPGEIVLFKCPVQIDQSGTTCEKTFKQKGNLERHIRSHQQIKSHMCSDCGKSFVDSTRLKEHRWIHTGHRPFKCNYCDKGFRHQNHLRNHEANTHGEDKKFPCQICNKKFVYAYQLRTHLQTHKSSGRQVETDELFRLASTSAPSDGPSGMQCNGWDQQFVQTLYQCSSCHQVLATFQLLQEHCLNHVDDENGCTPVNQVNQSAIAENQSQILIEINDEPRNADDQTINKDDPEDHHQFVVVYDVPTNL